MKVVWKQVVPDSSWKSVKMTVVFLTRSMQGFPEVTSLTLSLIRTHCDSTSTQSRIWINYHNHKKLIASLPPGFLVLTWLSHKHGILKTPIRMDRWMHGWMFDTHINFTNVIWSQKNQCEKNRDLWEIGYLKSTLHTCVDADVLGLICQSDTQRSQRMGMILVLVSAC